MQENRLEKVRKLVFYKHTNIVTKYGGEKTREKLISRNTRISRAKNDGKKSCGKSAKSRFFYKHTNIVIQKWGEKTREKFYPETQISQANNDGKKSSGKSAKSLLL